MTAISDTPAQQLARIAEIEASYERQMKDGMNQFPDFVDLKEIPWVCALARQGVEARQKLVECSWCGHFATQPYFPESEPQSPEGTP